MALADTDPLSKPFIPGTTGWTAADLNDSAIESQWLAGSYEIIEGVLTLMAPAYFYGQGSATNLIILIGQHLKDQKIGGGLSFDVDIIVDTQRVVRADVAYLSAADKQKQAAAARAAGKADPRRSRLLVPPTLVIEAVSPGHERHDRQTKFAWYAEMGVAHYWLLEPFEKSLTCYTLKNGKYELVVAARESQVATAPPFPDLQISLDQVWADE